MMLALPVAVQNVLIGVIVAAALVFIIRLRLKAAKSRRSGSCANCSLEH